jgi:hypothetical protein
MIDDHDDPGISRVDLTPIDPLLDRDRFDVLARTIVRDGMTARRAAIERLRAPGAMAAVARWSMPILAAAAVVVAAAVPTLAWSGRSLSSAGTSSQATMDRFGLPAPILALTRSGSDPTPADVVAAFDSRWLEATR